MFIYDISMQKLNLVTPLSADLLTGPHDVELATEPRPAEMNKYTTGSILIVGGGVDYHGAPILAADAANNAIAALRTGVGYVTIFVPKDKANLVRKISPNLIVKAYDGMSLSRSYVSLICEAKHNVAVIGPGLGKSGTIYDGVAALVERENGSGKLILIDGDAIGAIAKHKRLIGKNMILTPHRGEFARLTGVDSDDATLSQLTERAISFAKSYNCVIVLKGHETVITDGKMLKINISKSSALATMGTGDVLSGIIAAYLASHKNTFESATAGVYVHSMIGDMLNESHGHHIIAEDVVRAIPDFLKHFDKN